MSTGKTKSETRKQVAQYVAATAKYPTVPLKTLRASPYFHDALNGAVLILPTCGCRIVGSGVLQDPLRIEFCKAHAEAR